MLVRSRQITAALSARLDLNQPISPDRFCIHCGVGEQPTDALRPHSVTVWLHNECQPPWFRAPQIEATDAPARLDPDPPISQDRVCIYCRVGEQPNNPLRPYGAPTWIHGRCRTKWSRARKIQATDALSAMGIPPPWHETAEGWRKFYSERARINQFRYRRGRYEAKAEAYRDCIGAWLDVNLVMSSDNLCSHCGTGKQPNDVWHSYGHIVHKFALAWLHEECCLAWIGERQTEAMAALLGAMGITPPADSRRRPKKKNRRTTTKSQGFRSVGNV